MNDFPSHILPRYTEDSRDDALFHYTTAQGLIGILTSDQIRSTAYFCANDESELSTGQGILTPLFRKATFKLIENNDPRVLIFARRGVDIMSYADQYEQFIAAMALNSLSTYITCFFRPTNEEDFMHGLLSQWRGYGTDGGYALHFSRQKLLDAIDRTVAKDNLLNYDFKDVYYSIENPLKTEVLRHSDAFLLKFTAYLDELAKPLDFNKTTTVQNPIAGLSGGPLEAFLNYLVHTKNRHFAEERESRLTLTQLASGVKGCLPVQYFNRAGLVVPYVQTPRDIFNVLDCVEWIVVGPGPRLKARFKSVTQMIQQVGRKINVRVSHIPFTRL
jgi:hypothetical protein